MRKLERFLLETTNKFSKKKKKRGRGEFDRTSIFREGLLGVTFFQRAGVAIFR